MVKHYYGMAITGETRFERAGMSVTVMPIYVRDSDTASLQYKVMETGEVYKIQNEAFAMARTYLRKIVKERYGDNFNLKRR